MDCELFL